MQWHHAGFACLAVRNRMGSWCGYVGVPSNHPHYGKDYHEVEVDVHGGLTYADKCDGAICHVAEAGFPEDVWWLGFDTAHAGDLMPYMKEMHPQFTTPDVYRDLAYIRRETNRLAKQLREEVGR